MKKLSDSNRNRLLRDARKEPSALLTRKKFWKPAFWPHYLRLCDDVLFDDPVAGLELALPAPELAAIICKRHPTEVSAPDLMICAYSLVAGANRRNDRLKEAKATFAEASKYADRASPPALGVYLLRLAYLRIVTHDPECFALVEQGLAVYKLGNLVNRHGIGHMLLCRGLAYATFDQHHRAFDDWAASLHHIDVKLDPKPWYCAVHNLALNAVEHEDTDPELLRMARTHIESARRGLKSFLSTRLFATLKSRWATALIDERLGAEGHAELELLDVRKRLADLGLSIEVGWLSIDLARLYLRQRRHQDLKALALETVEIFRQFEVEAKAQEALDLWHQAESVDDRLLQRVRKRFYTQAKPIPAGIAA